MLYLASTLLYMTVHTQSLQQSAQHIVQSPAIPNALSLCLRIRFLACLASRSSFDSFDKSSLALDSRSCNLFACDCGEELRFFVSTAAAAGLVGEATSSSLLVISDSLACLLSLLLSVSIVMKYFASKHHPLL